MSLRSIGLLALLSGMAAPAVAARAAGAAVPEPEAVRSLPQTAPLAQADDRSSLRQGVVIAMSPQNHWVFVNGSWLGIVEGRTKLFRQGRPVGRESLTKGQLLRFTLAPGVQDGTTLGVVYVP